MPIPQPLANSHLIPHDAAEPSPWTPVLTLPFPCKTASFEDAMLEMVLHPEHNSTWILRADILFDSENKSSPAPQSLRTTSIPAFSTKRIILRRFIPRNPQRDAPAEQTCQFLTTTTTAAEEHHLVIYTTHTSSVAETPYYLPQVSAIAFYLTYSTISLHYRFFPEADIKDQVTTRLERTALHLLNRVIKIAVGREAGYVKRVHHDTLVPRETFQDRYLALRQKHAKRLVQGWVEKTDPLKHVFEDILIAGFLIELWKGMGDGQVQRFVDIGCGNGVLVDILLAEGWEGYGFDARRRKSWAVLQEKTRDRLEEKVLVPWVLGHGQQEEGGIFHDGRFPEGTFIISNHADELTAWTPLLAAASRCPFLALPCCSHDLSGAKFRAPPKKGEQNTSTYASLVEYVARLAEDVGWVVEREVLRIPSTRNVAVIGRILGKGMSMEDVVKREGGGDGWVGRAMALTKGIGASSH